MKRYFCVFLMCVSGYVSIAQVENNTIIRPRLVVGIVVDQMRWDYLYKYYNRYGDGGFKRMISQGFSCENAHINYLPTFTAPGHASVYTGSVPAIHGISGNDWIDKETRRSEYCTGDTSESTVGSPSADGKMSPRKLLATTVTDELRLATNFRSKVYGISLKDRGSILPAGHVANGAYWFDDQTGNFISSSYYGAQLPEWLTAFNSKRWADTLIKNEWNLLYPAKTYKQSVVDNNKYEGNYKGETAPTFPHNVAGWKSRGYYGLRYMPGGNTILLKAARACIKNENLGQDNQTDFLCLSLSTPDYVGHVVGPDAMEMEDMFLRLDKEIASFLSYLDNRVGEDNYLVFLTADHGAAHNSEYLNDMNVPAGNIGKATTKADLNALIKKQFGYGGVIRSMMNYQVWLNEDSIKDKSKRNLVKDVIIDYLGKEKGVAHVIDMERIGNATVPDPILKAVINGYNRKRSGCIQIILQPGWYSESVVTGTTHGSWHAYDTHLPLLWYGWGIKKGTTHRTVNITDIAPTLSSLLHIQMPSGTTGNVITEITDK